MATVPAVVVLLAAEVAAPDAAKIVREVANMVALKNVQDLVPEQALQVGEENKISKCKLYR